MGSIPKGLPKGPTLIDSIGIFEPVARSKYGTISLLSLFNRSFGLKPVSIKMDIPLS